MPSCRSCNSKSLTTDPTTGETVCSSCGIVQPFDNYQHHFGGVSDAHNAGTFVHVGTAGSGTDFSYKDRKLYHSNNIIEDITFRLNLTPSSSRDVKIMVSKVTDNEFGLGEWFSVLVGACCYIVLRNSDVTNNGKNSNNGKYCLRISEVCEAVGCELYQMGRMVGRVVDHLGLEMKEFDVVGLVERTVRGYSGFEEVEKEKVEVMVSQGVFVVQCAVKWFLTTGRRPGPMAVAVLVFVAGVNGVKVKIEEVAKEVNEKVVTCKARYKELLEVFVEVAKGLPWGKDVNVKNVVRNAPFVLRYMEMKSMEKGGGSGFKRKRQCGEEEGGGGGGFDLESKLRKCLGHGRVENVGQVESGGHLEYSGNARDQDGVLSLTSHEHVVSDNDVETGVQCLVNVGDEHSGLGGNELEIVKVSHLELAKIYSKFKEDIANRNMVNVENRGNGEDFQLLDEWWTGRSELCQKLMMEQLMEKDVGFEALPPSYVRGCNAIKRRREKIKAAKIRINRIMCPPSYVSNKQVRCSGIETQTYSEDDSCTSEYVVSRKKKRKHHDDIDWEDFIIEALLLHQVKEEQIEKGHYNALLGLHVFKSGIL